MPNRNQDQATHDDASRSKGRGFAGMDAQQQRQIASAGGRAAHASGNAHEFTSEEARQAGRKGGEARSQRSRSDGASQVHARDDNGRDTSSRHASDRDMRASNSRAGNSGDLANSDRDIQQPTTAAPGASPRGDQRG